MRKRYVKNRLFYKRLIYFACNACLFFAICTKAHSQSTLIWNETFGDDNGSTSEIAGSSWITDNDHIDTDESLWETLDGRFTGSNLLGIGILKTEAIDISEYENISATVEIEGGGSMEANIDFLNIYYRLDNGPRILWDNGAQTGSFPETTATLTGLNGKWLEVIIEAYNTFDNEFYYVDNIEVSGVPITVPEANIWDEDFNELADSTEIDTGITGWTLDNSNTNTSTGRFDVRYQRFEAVNVDAVSTWISEVIDIVDFVDVEIALDAYGFGYLGFQGDFMNVYYKVDDGPRVLLENGFLTGRDGPGWTVDPVVASASDINGSTLQLIVEMRNGTENERFSIDNIKISGTSVPGLEVTLSSDTITCFQSEVVITTTTNRPDSLFSFSWSDEDGFFSLEQNPTVTQPGEYTLEVINSAGAVVASESITIVENTTTPPLEVLVDGFITCTNEFVTLSADTQGVTVSYSWTGPDGFVSDSSAVAVNVEGVYLLTVANMSNGCTTSDSVVVRAHLAQPSVEIKGGDLTCEVTEVKLKAITDLFNVSYEWTGPNGFMDTTKHILVSDTGVYSLVVTNNDNGCDSTATFTVGQNTDLPDLMAEGGEVGCANLTDTLTASSSTPGVTYFWEGPDFFTSMEQNPVISLPGEYQITVTDTTSGCSNSMTVTVIEVNDIPDVSLQGGEITCENSEVLLEAISSRDSLAYSWEGPDGVLGSDSIQLVSEPGAYTVTVTDPNGCTNEATAMVTESILIPDVIVFGGTITCADTSIHLLATTSIDHPLFLWLDANGDVISNVSNPEVSNPGIYQVTVTDSLNGCSNTKFINVDQNVIEPPVEITKSGDLTCTVGAVTLTTQSLDGVAYDWRRETDSTGYLFTSDVQSPTVTRGGTYIVDVTYSVSGCVNSDTVVVSEFLDIPDLEAVGDTITCDQLCVTLTATSETAGVTYSWTGPNGFTSEMQNPEVCEPGSYFVSVTDPVTGCVNVEEARVIENTVQPDLMVTIEGEFTCDNSEVTLTAKSGVDSVLFSWTGPNGFTSTDSTIVVDVPGDYTVEITNPVNGCTNTSTNTLEENEEVPALRVEGLEDITCDNPVVTLVAISPVGGVMFSWSDSTGTVISMNDTLEVSIPGIYTTMIIDPVTGCGNSATVTVASDTIPPTVSATVSGTLTCVVSKVELGVTTNASPAAFEWEGPNGFVSFEQSPLVSDTGVYIVTVINGSNGCSASDTISVTENKAIPDLMITENTLTCKDTLVTISASSSLSTVTFSWTGPGGFTSTEEDPAVGEPGNYFVTATDTVNGCTNKKKVTVDENRESPTIVATGGVLTCSMPSAQLTVESDVDSLQLSYLWVGPNGFFSTEQNPVVTDPGTYSVAVTNIETECFATADVVVEDDREALGLTASGNEITCFMPNVIIAANSNNPDVIFEWTGPEGFTSNIDSPTVEVPGEYIVTAIDMKSGCDSSMMVIVTENTDDPVIVRTIPGDFGALSCDVPTLTLGVEASGADSILYYWTGPGGFVSEEPSPVVSEPGVYNITVINAENGCFSESTISISEDVTPPDVVVPQEQLSITCGEQNVQILVTSEVPGAIFSWDGPDNFSDSISNPTVDVPGTYVVTVKNPSTGCINSASVEVIDNRVNPNIIAIFGGTITCSNASVTLDVVVDTTNVRYLWIGPIGSGFFSSKKNPVVTLPGVYTVVVTNRNNECYALSTTSVFENTELPDLTAVSQDTITCVTTEATIRAISTTPGVIYSWSGPEGFSSNDSSASVTLAGDYTVIVTNPINGCTNEAVVTVIENCSGRTSLSTASDDASLDRVRESDANHEAAATDNLTTPAIEMKTYPNPFIESAVVSFTSDVSTKAMLTLYNLSGQEQKVLFEGPVLKGMTYEVELTHEGLEEGIYLCHLIMDEKVTTQKIVLRR